MSEVKPTPSGPYVDGARVRRRSGGVIASQASPPFVMVQWDDDLNDRELMNVSQLLPEQAMGQAKSQHERGCLCEVCMVRPDVIVAAGNLLREVDSKAGVMRCDGEGDRPFALISFDAINALDAALPDRPRWRDTGGGKCVVCGSDRPADEAKFCSYACQQRSANPLDAYSITEAEVQVALDGIGGAYLTPAHEVVSAATKLLLSIGNDRAKWVRHVVLEVHETSWMRRKLEEKIQAEKRMANVKTEGETEKTAGGEGGLDSVTKKHTL